MVRAAGENSFRPKIGLKTRYGLVSNPFAEGNNQGMGSLTLTRTTTEELRLRTSCDIISLRVKEVQEGSWTPFFI